MKNSKICPVCGKEKKQIPLSEYDCEYCGFSNAFVQFFANKEGYDNWKNTVRAAVEKYKDKKREDLADSKCLVVGSNAVSFLDVNNNIMHIALGNGRVQTEKNALQFSSSERNYAILYKSGSVKVFGDDNEFGQKNTEGWGDIICIATAPNCTYGVTKEGTVVHAGALMDPSILKWKQLKILVSSDEFILGVHSDGKVSLSSQKSAITEVENVKRWTNIKSIALSKTCIIGLLGDGGVKCASKPEDPRHQCETWKNIIAVAVDNTYVYGLTRDGSILVAGSCKSFLDKGRKNASTWKDIVAISCNKSGVGAVSSSGNLYFAGTIAGDEKKVREQWNNSIVQHIEI